MFTALDWDPDHRRYPCAPRGADEMGNLVPVQGGKHHVRHETIEPGMSGNFNQVGMREHVGTQRRGAATQVGQQAVVQVGGARGDRTRIRAICPGIRLDPEAISTARSTRSRTFGCSY